ncbi:protein hunchback [Bacillus rossius redtenbacheri]|uniref:protein hunchback n=1 Tax=Bacillus rossius redtenbacheri TaxID=93214 RepID=UPI002FDCE1E6
MVEMPRAEFEQHVGEHYSHKCTLCDFSDKDVERLRAHLRDEHDQYLMSPEGSGDGDGAMEADDDEPGVRVPRVNSQGKVKTFRCKQCAFVSVTKVDFWEHSRSHIKADKLLTCPKCPFVTEYKHHLEYHLRNHFNSKPFKCSQCAYSCVNKSMLNSHLKSHSDVYQYRCADCSYATKYCHSLKLHLRKYSHQPAMVLNPDGTPNPEPIIDVYGTRRGPKQRGRGADKQAEAVFPPAPCLPVFPQHYGAMPSAFAYGGVFLAGGAGLPVVPGLQEDAPVACLDKMLLTHFNNNNNNNNNNNADELERHEARQEPDKQPGAPLDLSMSVAVAPGPPACAPNNHTTSPKSRRKGKAFKLERIAMKLQHRRQSDDEDSAPRSAGGCDVRADTTSSPQQEEQQQPAPESAETYDCSYCDITFKDVVMYTVHMGYHGYRDPFKCNMCGQQTADKVAFFLHIARSSHS